MFKGEETRFCLEHSEIANTEGTMHFKKNKNSVKFKISHSNLSKSHLLGLFLIIIFT